MPKLTKYLLIIFSTCIIFLGCTEQKKESITEIDLTSFSWMLGTWKGVYNDNEIIEIWNKDDEKTFSGHSYYILNQDTNHLERVKIQVIDNEIFFSADVPHNKSIVTFLKTKSTGNSITFENKNHDFPTKIEYELINKNKLKATVSGMQQDELKSDVFSYTKVD